MIVVAVDIPYINYMYMLQCLLGVVAFFVWKQLKNPAAAGDSAGAAEVPSETEKDHLEKGIEFVLMEESNAPAAAKE